LGLQLTDTFFMQTDVLYRL